MHRLPEISYAGWRQMGDVNLHGAANLTYYVCIWPHRRPSGHPVSILDLNGASYLR